MGRGVLRENPPMMPFAFELITTVAALALGFAIGRVWEIRQQMIKSRKHEGFNLRPIPTAHIPEHQH